MVDLKYVVTGTGRCGTAYMAELLTSVGILCAHESIFTYDGMEEARRRLIEGNWLVSESSYMAAPYLTDPILKDVKIIHVVRHPISVINSFVVAFCYFLSGTLEGPAEGDWVYEYPPGADPEFKFMKFMYHHVPSLTTKKLHPAVRACMYYVAWNKMIEDAYQEKDCLLQRLEDDMTPVVRFVGSDSNDFYRQIVNKADYEPMFNIDDIPDCQAKVEMIDMGRRYGYEC